jgi:hypothetical protein
LNKVGSANRREPERATHRVNVIAREQQNFAGTDFQGRLAGESDEHASFDDHVVANHLHQVRHEPLAVRHADLGRHAPRRREAGLKEHASYEANRSKYIG